MTTPFGNYTYVGTPFGLTDAGLSMCSAGNIVLRGIDNTILFIDDIVISSESVEKHKEDVRQVLYRLIEYNVVRYAEMKIAYGENQRLPIERWELVKKRDHMEDDMHKLWQKLNRMGPIKTERHGEKPSYVPDSIFDAEYVWIIDDRIGNRKKDPLYVGPYRVLKATSKVFTVSKEGKPYTVSIDRLKEYKPPLDANFQPSNVIGSNSDRPTISPEPNTNSTPPNDNIAKMKTRNGPQYSHLKKTRTFQYRRQREDQ
ncbi:hypothetical protein Ciccas_004457 [Cichlidogyrus casuarinus]|uniref:Reverse transcriptase domain-containing protein n=1 Tax=Cichlidogyrus casuarinus TaxID=1844966 RepID=A0ABD2QBJ6_9PLAT